LDDIAGILAMGDSQMTKARAWGADPSANTQHLKIYHRNGPLDLSEIVPVLERMGLRAKA
jgi:NAD-specific glutamate dehydrogenase